MRNFGEFRALFRVFVRDLSGFCANFAQILCVGRPLSERRGPNIFARRAFFGAEGSNLVRWTCGGVREGAGASHAKFLGKKLNILGISGKIPAEIFDFLGNSPNFCWEI